MAGAQPKPSRSRHSVKESRFAHLALPSFPPLRPLDIGQLKYIYPTHAHAHIHQELAVEGDDFAGENQLEDQAVRFLFLFLFFFPSLMMSLYSLHRFLSVSSFISYMKHLQCLVDL